MSAALGGMIRALREGAGLTRSQVAAHIGVTPSAVGKWERGERHPRRPERHMLTDALAAGMTR